MPTKKQEKKKVSDELKEEGIDPKKYKKAMNTIKPLPRIHKKHTTIPGIDQEELARIYDYMERKGILKRREGEKGVYDVDKNGIDAYDARLKAESLYSLLVASLGRAGIRVHGE